MGSVRGSPIRERKPTTAIAIAVITIGIAHHTSADTFVPSAMNRALETRSYQP